MTDAVIDRRTPAEYSIALIERLSDRELRNLATLCDTAQNIFSRDEHHTLLANWLAAMCQSTIAGRKDEMLEQGTWELPRLFYADPVALAAAMHEANAIRDFTETANQKQLVGEILRDLITFANHYLTKCKFE